jgi:hypothetical protein
MNEANYTMTEEEIKAQGVMEGEDAEETITDENFAEAAEKNVWDGEKWVTEEQYNRDIMAAFAAQTGGK